MKKCLLPDIPTAWEEIMNQGIRERRNKSLRDLACKSRLGMQQFTTFGGKEMMSSMGTR